MKKKTLYFPGLHGLRCIAALMVIVTHVELFKARYGLPNIYHFNKNFGVYGVDFFFVLSGFLITYLLFKEDEKFGFINLKFFYLRRIFRIWPLYYLLIIIVFFLVPLFNYPIVPGYNLTDNYIERLCFFIFFLPNVSKSFFEFIPYGGVMWSVGVEEQFYVLWPLLLKYSKNYLKTILYSIVFFILIKIVIIIPFFDSFFSISKIRTLLAYTRIELMAVGALGAYALYYKKYTTVILNKHTVNLSVVLMFLLMFFLPKSFDNVLHIFLSLPFVLLIINVAKGRTLFSFESKFFRWLGNISYGMYMYHMFIAGGIIYLFKDLSASNFIFNIIIYILIIGLTILVSHFSLRFIERPFLILKGKFTVVKSGVKD